MSIMHSQIPQTYYPQPQFVAPQQTIQQPVYQAPQQQQQIPQPSPTISNIFYVQGEAAAKAYPVAFGKGVVLFDSERDYFYIKEVDRYGVPKPLRKFPYKEELEEEVQPTVQLQQTEPVHDYVTRDEFEKRIAEITKPVEMVQPNHHRKHKENRNGQFHNEKSAT